MLRSMKALHELGFCDVLLVIDSLAGLVYLTVPFSFCDSSEG